MSRPTAAPSGGGPFERLRPAALTAACYGLAALAWVAAGDRLPGGRWLAVHLFTLGVVTNLILALSDHFARTLTHQPGTMPRWQLPVTNAGVLLVLWAIPNGERSVVAFGASVVTAVVLASYVRLRGLRRSALAPRFGWVVRAYERAHGAFVHGAILGALLGTGVLAGRWYAAGRVAHLHVNLLGWAGLTLLATLVFFGPTVGRTRIEPGADVRAARALRVGATSVTLAVLLLLASGVGGPLGTALRVAAGLGLAAFAWSVVVVCLDVVRAGLRARSPVRWGVIAAATWFAGVACADAAVAAAGHWSSLEPLGAAMLLGVLAQAIAASLGYLAPNLRPLGRGRDAVRVRAETLAVGRAVTWNVGVVLVVAAAAAGPGAGWGWVSKAGWALALGAIAAQAALIGSGWLVPDEPRPTG